MASTEEKLLTLLLSSEHLKEAAKEQQKAVADSLVVARETLKGYRDISDNVAKQVRAEIHNEVQKLDVASLIGERISDDFQRLETSVEKMKENAEALNKEISRIRHTIVKEYNMLKGYSWWWLVGVIAFAAVVIIIAIACVKIELKNANNVSANNYHQIKILQEKIDKLTVLKTGKH